MIFELFCITLFGLFFGAAISFAGYSVFRALLPVFGFVYGFAIGADTMRLIFGVGFLTNLTSWIVGLVVGIAFAFLAYRFFRFAIALVAGSLAYGVGVSILLWIGLRPGLIAWVVGTTLAAMMIYATFKLRLEKYVIVLNTSIVGAAVIVNALKSTGGEVALSTMAENPIREMLQGSPLWTIIYLAIVVAGAIFQIKTPSTSYWREPPIIDALPPDGPMNYRAPNL